MQHDRNYFKTIDQFDHHHLHEITCNGNYYYYLLTLQKETNLYE